MFENVAAKILRYLLLAAPPPVNGRTDYTCPYSVTPLLLLPLLTDGQITLAHILPHPLLLIPLLTDYTCSHSAKPPATPTPVYDRHIKEK